MARGQNLTKEDRRNGGLANSEAQQEARRRNAQKAREAKSNKNR